MDQKFKGLMDRARSTAQSVGSAANSTARSFGQRAAAVKELSRLALQLREVNADISALLRDVGQISYNTHLGMEDDPSLTEQLFRRLDEKNAQAMELRNQIDETKRRSVCPVCGAPIAPDAKFCKACGVILQ